ncbi:MAG: GntR family transcriptional regulator [Verrucomicrobiae bacterium]|nr:GntR family transcriptional regulator [Verrucomicrobiae bacterium]
MKLELNVQTADPISVQIERFLRRQILSGQLQPATRLPPTMELSRRWRVDNTAVSLALARLAEEGLLERAPRRGTFVRKPDRKVLIGLLASPRLTNPMACFARAIVEQIQKEVEAREDVCWGCRVYDSLFELEGVKRIKTTPLYQRIESDLRNNLFKGFVQIHGKLNDYNGSALEWGLPTVRMGLAIPEARSDVVLDFYHFGQEAVRYLAAGGRKRIVYLRTHDSLLDGSLDVDGVVETAKAAGVEVEVEFLLRPCEVDFEKKVHMKTRQLLERWKKRRGRPEALLVADDIAMRGVAYALMEKGIRVPEEIQLLTMANEGVEHYYGMPVVRCEFSMKAAARAILEVLWKRMMKKADPKLPVKIPVVVSESN